MCTEWEQNSNGEPCCDASQGRHAMNGSIYADRMTAILNASRRRGEQDKNTLARVCRAYGLPYWTCENLRKGRAKTVPLDLLDRLGAVWLQICERELRRWEEELATERAKGFVDDDLDHLEREAANLRARLDARRARQEKRR